MVDPVRVGIIGAGPWVPMFYIPVLKGGPETELRGAWARRPEAAAELATAHGVRVYPSPAALFDDVDAVVVAVAPAAQPQYALAAARAGKVLVLEKPLAESLADAEGLAAALSAVPAMVMLTNRYNTILRQRLAEARSFEAFAARGQFLSGAFLPGSPFAFGWRLEQGALLDVGPHIVDLAWEALGPIVRVRAAGHPLRAVALELTHESGAVSQLLVSATLGITRQDTGLELFGPSGRFAIDPGPGRETVAPTIRAELAAMAASRRPHPVGVDRALALQRIIDEAGRQLDS